MRLNKRIIFVFLILLLNIHSLQAQDKTKNPSFIPIGYLEILCSYSDIDKGRSLWGYDVWGYFSPIIKLSDTLTLIPLYNGEFQRMRQYVSQEEGGRFYQTSQIHNISLCLRKEFKPGWFFKITPFGTWNYLKETKDEKWGKGLYDYRDAGCRFGLRHNFGEDSTFNVSTEYFHRKYPNFKSLIYLATQQNVDKNEKDFDAVKFSFSVSKEEPVKMEILFYIMLKYFTDKHLVREDGTLDVNNKRRDEVYNLDFNFTFPLRDNISFCLNNTFFFNHSNLGFYDSKNTLTLSDDYFNSKYYTYWYYFIFPHLIYYLPLSEKKYVEFKLGYSLLFRKYLYRKAQTEDGIYGTKRQRDLEHTIHFSLKWPLTRKINWILKFNYTLCRSNQRYEAYYRYRYDIYQIRAGFSFQL